MVEQNNLDPQQKGEPIEPEASAETATATLEEDRGVDQDDEDLEEED